LDAAEAAHPTVFVGQSLQIKVNVSDGAITFGGPPGGQGGWFAMDAQLVQK